MFNTVCFVLPVWPVIVSEAAQEPSVFSKQRALVTAFNGTGIHTAHGWFKWRVLFHSSDTAQFFGRLTGRHTCKRSADQPVGRGYITGADRIDKFGKSIFQICFTVRDALME